MKLTYISYMFEVASMRLDDETNVEETVENYENAVKTALVQAFPGAQVEIEGTYGTDGAPDQVAVAGEYEDGEYEHDAKRRVKDIAQDVWSRVAFEWVEK